MANKQIPSRMETYGKKGRKAKKQNLPIFRKALPKDLEEFTKPNLTVLEGKGKKKVGKKVATLGIVGCLLVGSGVGASLLATWNGQTNLDSVVNKVTDFVNGKNQEITDLQTQISNLIGEKDGLNSQIEELNTTINGHLETIAQHEQTIADLQEQINLGNSNNEELTAQINQLKEEKQTLQNEVEELTNTINGLNETVASKNTEITNLQAQLEERQNMIDEKDSQIAELLDELGKANTSAVQHEEEINQVLGIEEEVGDVPVVDEVAGNQPAQPSESPENGEVGDDNQVEEVVIDTEYLENNVSKTFSFNDCSQTNLEEGNIYKLDGGSNDYYVMVQDGIVTIYNQDATINQEVEITSGSPYVTKNGTQGIKLNVNGITVLNVSRY